MFCATCPNFLGTGDYRETHDQCPACLEPAAWIVESFQMTDDGDQGDFIACDFASDYETAEAVARLMLAGGAEIAEIHDDSSVFVAPVKTLYFYDVR